MHQELVDTHTHVFSRTGPFAANARYRPAYDADLETLRNEWGGNGVTHGVLIQPSFYGTDNSVLLAALARHPEQLRGVVVVDPSIEQADLAAWDRLGVRGIRLNLLGVHDYGVFSSRDWARVYRDVAAIGWHVEVQPEPGLLPEILRTLDGCPATIVVDHFGRPDPTKGSRCETFDALRTFASGHRVYAKLSGAYRNEPADCGAFAHRLLQDLGPERLMWASDWPWTNFESRGFRYAETVRALSDWVPDAAAHQTVAWDTPANVFGFAARGASE